MGKRTLHIGCGAIGSHTVTRLCQDIDFLLLCDMDVVGPENLGIADFFPEDVGQRKVSVLANRLRAGRPSMHVAEIDGDVSRVSPEMIDSFDLISAAVDNDRAAFTICRIVAQSEKKPCVVFANCDPRSGSAQIRILNYNRNKACLGCARSHDRWDSPVSTPHSCARGGSRASGEAARFASALQVSVVSDLLQNDLRRNERAGENLILNPAGAVLKSRLTFSEDCPAFYHVYVRRVDNTIHLEDSVKNMTVRTLLEITADQLGNDAFIELGERRCSDRFFCPACSTSRVFDRTESSLLRLTDSNPLCSCGSLMIPVGDFRRLKASLRDSAITNVSLAQCGFPEGDLFLAATKNRYRYFATQISPACNHALMIEGKHEKP
jgi:molybdopterin/thiamine biosynthesis adenylyltransferase